MEVAIRHRRNTTSKPHPAGPTEQPKRIDEKAKRKKHKWEDAAARQADRPRRTPCLSRGALRHFSSSSRRSARLCRRRPTRLLPLVSRTPRLVLPPHVFRAGAAAATMATGAVTPPPPPAAAGARRGVRARGILHRRLAASSM